MKDKYEITIIAVYADDADFRPKTSVEHVTAADERHIPGAVKRAFCTVIDREFGKVDHPTAPSEEVELLQSVARNMVSDKLWLECVTKPFNSLTTSVTFDKRHFAVKCGVPSKLIVDIENCTSDKETPHIPKDAGQYADAPDDAKRLYDAYNDMVVCRNCIGSVISLDRMRNSIDDMMSKMSDEGWDYIIGHAKDENERSALKAKRTYFKTICTKKDSVDELLDVLELPDVLETVEPTETTKNDDLPDGCELTKVNVVYDTPETFGTKDALETTASAASDMNAADKLFAAIEDKYMNGNKFNIIVHAKYLKDGSHMVKNVSDYAVVNGRGRIEGAVCRMFLDIVKDASAANGAEDEKMRRHATSKVLNSVIDITYTPFVKRGSFKHWDARVRLDTNGKCGVPDVFRISIDDIENPLRDETEEKPSVQDGAEKTTETEPVDFRKIASFLMYAAERLENGDTDFENAVLAVKKAVDSTLSDNHTTIPR